MPATGTVFDIKKFAIHDGPGIRTTVFFKGCPLSCWWCHNPEGLKSEPEALLPKIIDATSNSPSHEQKEVIGREVSTEELMVEIKKDIIFYDQSGGGVTLSGGEPLMQEAFLIEILEACKNNRINTAVDTSGYAPWEMFERMIGLVDIFLYDLKILDDEDHKKYTGVSNELILDNLTRLSEKKNKTIIRIPMIPGITDTEVNLESLAGFLDPLKNIFEIDLLPYNKLREDKLRRFNLPSTVGPFPTQAENELNDKARQYFSQSYKVRIGG